MGGRPRPSVHACHAPRAASQPVWLPAAHQHVPPQQLQRPDSSAYLDTAFGENELLWLRLGLLFRFRLLFFTGTEEFHRGRGVLENAVAAAVNRVRLRRAGAPGPDTVRGPGRLGYLRDRRRGLQQASALPNFLVMPRGCF